MEPSWGVVIAAVGVISGILYGGVPLFKMLGEWVEAWRKNRHEKKKIDQTASVEFKKVELDDRAQINADLWEIIESKNKEIERLEKKCERLENLYDLPKELKTKINQAVKAVNRQVDNLRSLVERDERKENLLIEIDILDQKVSEVDILLP